MRRPSASHTAIANILVAHGPVVGVCLTGCRWWGGVIVAALAVYLNGAEAAMRWLDVIARIREDHMRTSGPCTRCHE